VIRRRPRPPAEASVPPMGRPEHPSASPLAGPPARSTIAPRARRRRSRQRVSRRAPQRPSCGCKSIFSAYARARSGIGDRAERAETRMGLSSGGDWGHLVWLVLLQNSPRRPFAVAAADSNWDDSSQRRHSGFQDPAICPAPLLIRSAHFES